MSESNKRQRDDEEGSVGPAVSFESAGQLERELDEYAARCRAFAAELGAQAERVARLRAQLLEDAQRHLLTVAQRQKQVEEIRELVLRSSPQQVVRLNVGGTIFGVAHSCLTQHPLSYFGMINLAQPGADGSYFVDRSPVVFDLVLAHLRGEAVSQSFRATERPRLEQLLADARFYGLNQLEEEVRKELDERWILSPTANGTLLDSGLSLLKTGDQGGKACIAVGSTGWTDGVHTFTVVISGEGGAHAGVGVTRGGVHQTDLLRNVHLFYALDCGNGRAIGVGGVAKQIIDQVPATGFAPGTRVSVRIDLGRRIVSFAIGDTRFIESFTNIAPGIYYPYFFIGQMEKKITIVER